MVIQGKMPGNHRPINLIVEGEVISRIEPDAAGTPYDFGGPDFYLFGGFFDPQVNGYAGVDFNGSGLTPEALHRAACSLASSGVTRFFPTVITAPYTKIVHQLKILAGV